MSAPTERDLDHVKGLTGYPAPWHRLLCRLDDEGCPVCASPDVSTWGESGERTEENYRDHLECGACGLTASRPDLAELQAALAAEIVASRRSLYRVAATQPGYMEQPPEATFVDCETLPEALYALAEQVQQTAAVAKSTEPLTGEATPTELTTAPLIVVGAWHHAILACTGAVDENGALSHDGDSCPIHEAT